MINSKITNTKKVFKDFAKYSVKTNITMKIIYTFAVLILAASVVLFVSNHILDGAIFACLGVIFALCTPAMEWLNVSNNKNNVGSVDEFEFYEDRFEVTSLDKKGLEISSSTLIYSRLYKVKKYLNYGYIYVNKAVAYIVDKNEFEDEEQFNFVLDRIDQEIIKNKKNKGVTPVVFGSQNVTAPTEEPPQDLGEPVPPPPTEEDLAYEEEQKENQRITSFEGEQKIDYEGEVTIVPAEDKEETTEEEISSAEVGATEEENSENEETVNVAEVDNPENEENVSEGNSEEDDDDDEGDAPAEQTYDVENENVEAQTVPFADEVNEDEEVENDNQENIQPMSDEVMAKQEEPEVQSEVEDVVEATQEENQFNLNVEQEMQTRDEIDNDDDEGDAPAEQVPTQQVEDLAVPTEETVDTVNEDEEDLQPTEEVVNTFKEPVVEEAPVEQETAAVVTPVQQETEEKSAEDKAEVEEVQPKKKRGRPVGSTKKSKEDGVKEKPKGKRGRPAGTTKKKTTENKTPGKRGRPAKSKTEKEDKPKGKRGRPAKAKPVEEANKPKGKRGRPAKKKAEVAETQTTQDVAPVESSQQAPVVVAPVVTEPVQHEQASVQQVAEESTVEPVAEERPVVEEAPVVEEVQPVVEQTTQTQTAEEPAIENYNVSETVEEPTQQSEFADEKREDNLIANNFANDIDNDDDDEGDAAAEQQPVNFDMPNDLGEDEAEQAKQVSQEDLDEVAALEAEYNMSDAVEPQVNVQPQQYAQPEEDFKTIEGPADLGEPNSVAQPPVIEDTEEDNDAYDAENETFTVSTGDVGSVENQKVDNSNTNINNVNYYENGNNDANTDDVGDIDVNIDDVNSVVDGLTESVKEDNTEDVNIDEFPTDIDDDSTKNN